MKNNVILLIFSLTWSFCVMAQKQNSETEGLNFGLNDVKTAVEYKQGDFFLLNENTANHLANAKILPENFTLMFKKQYVSLTQIHYRYQLQYKGVEVFLGEYHFAIDKKTGELQEVNYTLLPMQVLETDVLNNVAVPTNALTESEMLESEKQVLFAKGDVLVPAVYMVVKNAEGHTTQRVYNATEFLYQKEAHVYHHQEQRGPNDTIISAYVFNPDPLTTSFNVYGGAYVDSNDTRVPVLEAERQLKPVVLTKGLLGSILMENDAARLEDFAPPFSGVTQGSSATFKFSRDENGFEDMNVLYHLLEQYTHLQTLGFTGYPGYRIPVDPHGFSGADNSRVNVSATPVSMEFGEGGVDDAEDADVIIHEYNHALQLSFTGMGANSSERQNIEEGLADYFCVSYSKSINPFNFENIFTWDGHNEYWAGREATSSKNYKNITFNSNPYQHSDLLVACLLEIYDSLGRDKTDQLIWEAMFSLNPGTTMPQFAMATLRADDNLNGGAHKSAVKSAFVNYGILEGDIGLLEKDNSPSAKVFATNLFAYGQYALVNMQQAGTLKLYASNGMLVGTYAYADKGEDLKIPSNTLTAGVYLLQIQTDNGQLIETVKLVRL